MAEFTNYLENKLLDHVLNNESFTSPTTVYVGLFTAAPTDTTSGTEVSGGSYARQVLSVSTASDGIVTSDSDITFPQATGNWGTVVALGVHDADSSGNLLMYTDLTTSKTIETGDILKISTGSLTVSLD
jgi:hypothetical protein